MNQIAMFAAAVFGCPAAGLACEPTGVLGWDRNLRIEVGADCSFENAGARTSPLESRPGMQWKPVPHDNTSGDAAINLNNGLVAQVVGTIGSCAYREHLIVADCSSGDAIAIAGVLPPAGSVEIAGFVGAYVDYAVGPEGRMRIYRSDGLDEVVERARSMSLTVVDDALTLQDGWLRRDRYDPLCGCQLFYPDLTGATQ